jgi:phospholipase C
MLSRRKFLQISAASTGLAIAGTDLLGQAVANASSTVRAQGSRGIRHIVILMMENRSFDHFLGWVPGADGRRDLTFVSAVDGNTYPNYPLARTSRAAGTATRITAGKAGSSSTTTARWTGSSSAPRPRRTTRASRSPRRTRSRSATTPIPTPATAARRCPICRSPARWPSSTRRWITTCARSPARHSPTGSTSTLDGPTGTTTPAFDNEGDGTSGDDHPLGDIRLGERFIADAYHALADNGYLDSTVFVVTFDEWGGFYDHVPPPRVTDDTNPATVMHAGDSTTPTDGRLFPDYRQLGFRVPGIVVSNLTQPRRVVHRARSSTVPAWR